MDVSAAPAISPVRRRCFRRVDDHKSPAGRDYLKRRRGASRSETRGAMPIFANRLDVVHEVSDIDRVGLASYPQLASTVTLRGQGSHVAVAQDVAFGRHPCPKLSGIHVVVDRLAEEAQRDQTISVAIAAKGANSGIGHYGHISSVSERTQTEKRPPAARQGSPQEGNGFRDIEATDLEYAPGR